MPEYDAVLVDGRLAIRWLDETDAEFEQKMHAQQERGD
jgi:hypothetical protein